MTDQQQLEQAIAAQETLRGTLPDAVVDATIAALREKLAALAQTPVDEQRKLVTVLFADLAGWTAMSEQMDSEDVREIQQAYFAAVTPPILQRGGRVEKYIGDAILAVFGVPQAQEADPENAVRAALAMQQAMIALNDHLAKSSLPTSPLRSVPRPRPSRISDPLTSDALTSAPLPLSLRIGVHTGPVLATIGQGAQDFVVTGDTVNLAARLQTAAPPDSVFISHDTWRQVQGYFDVDPQEPLTVKGKTEPVRAYLVERARLRPFRKETLGVAGIVTRMVGREAELLALQNALQDVMVDGELRLVTVIGEGGVGKSRLLDEFMQWVEHIPETSWYFKGRASPDTERQPFGLLRDLLATRFGIVESDTLAAVHQKWESGLHELGVPGPGHLTGQLLGYDFSDSAAVTPLLDNPKQLREQALAELAKTFAALATQGPVLILLEDLHWADDSSLDVINHLAQALTHIPVLVLGAARPDLYERRPYWGEGRPFHSRLELRPLSKRATRELVTEILRRAEDAPASLKDMIISGAEGNPFFVEELVQMLVDDGVIDVTGDRWRVDLDKLNQAQIPATLIGVLQARLDRLPSEERTVLQQASVVGPVFWDRAVLACSSEHTIKDDEALVVLRSMLHTLRSRELVYHRETSVFENAAEHAFKHAILRDVTYESVLKRLRRVYHGLVADWLIEQTGERLGEFVGVIADHLERAGRTDEAVSYLMRAGDQARLVQAHREAVQRYEQALTILKEKGAYDKAARTCMRLGLTHQNAFEHAKARQAFDKGFVFWRQAGMDLQTTPVLPSAPHAFRITQVEPSTLDPTLYDDLPSNRMISHLFSGLVEPGTDFGVAPDIAHSWQVADNGRSYVFHLREDVRWSDGTPVTAGDFEYAWKRMLRPEAQARVASLWDDIKNANAYHQGKLAETERIGVRAVDDRTLVIELEQPVGYFLQLLATSSYPVPRHVVEARGETWAQPETIVTNGPYLLKSWQPGQSLTLRRNLLYHGQFRGNVTEVVVHLNKDWSTTVTMYEADELDTVSLSGSFAGLYAGGRFDLERVRQRHADEYVIVPSWGCFYLGLNASQRPFDDIRVRRALALACNREALADALSKEQYIPASGGFLPPEMPGHSPGIGLPYDPTQARQFLSQAGYPNGRGFPSVEVAVSEFATPQIEVLRQQWRDNLGIEVTPVVFDFRSLVERLRSAPPSLFIMGWSADYPDPDNFLRVGLKQERSLWQHETYERLVRHARRLTDQTERIRLYQQADQILVQEAAIIPLVYGRDHWLRKPWLTVFYRERGNSTKDVIISPH